MVDEALMAQRLSYFDYLQIGFRMLAADQGWAPRRSGYAEVFGTSTYAGFDYVIKFVHRFFTKQFPFVFPFWTFSDTSIVEINNRWGFGYRPIGFLTEGTSALVDGRKYAHDFSAHDMLHASPIPNIPAQYAEYLNSVFKYEAVFEAFQHLISSTPDADLQVLLTNAWFLLEHEARLDMNNPADVLKKVDFKVAQRSVLFRLFSLNFDASFAEILFKRSNNPQDMGQANKTFTQAQCDQVDALMYRFLSDQK
jgi:hypothetical protein